MNTYEAPAVQQQLRKPFCKRTLRFTHQGFNALQSYKERLQKELGRPVSDSVALDNIITGVTV